MARPRKRAIALCASGCLIAAAGVWLHEAYWHSDEAVRLIHRAYGRAEITLGRGIDHPCPSGSGPHAFIAQSVTGGDVEGYACTSRWRKSTLHAQPLSEREYVSEH